MSAPNLSKLIDRRGNKATPLTVPSKKIIVSNRTDDAGKKRKGQPIDPISTRPSKTQCSNRAIPIYKDDALDTCLSQLKINDNSVIGHSLKAADALGSLISKNDKHFLQSIDIPLLAEFAIHRTIQVSLRKNHSPECCPFISCVSYLSVSLLCYRVRFLFTAWPTGLCP